MKKSECYKLAQVAVLENTNLTARCKMAILRVLMDAEDLALFSEKQEADKEE